MYAKTIESSDRLLVIRIQRFRIKDLITIIPIPACLSIVIAAGIMGRLFFLILFLIPLLILLIAVPFVYLRRLSGWERKSISPREIVFDRTLRRIGISGKEERTLSFDDVQRIRYEHTRFFGSSGGQYGESLNIAHNYLLGLELSDTFILIASGSEGTTSRIKNEISEVLGKPATSDSALGHLEGDQERILRAAQEKLSKKHSDSSSETVSTQKQISDEEKEKLERTLHGDFGYGTYKGYKILSEARTNRMCPSCGNRLYEIRLAAESAWQERRTRNVLIVIASVIMGTAVMFSGAFPIKVSYKVRAHLAFLAIAFVAVIAAVGGFVQSRKERKGHTEIICKECDKHFLAAN